MNENKQPKRRWWLEGLIWGASMFVINVIIFPLAEKETLNTKKVFLGVVVWTIGGMLFGWVNKYFTKWLLKKFPLKNKK